MSYIPKNVDIFAAAYAGAVAGMSVAGRVLIDDNVAHYARISGVAGAFAQSFDTEWGLRATTQLDVTIVQEECEGAWEGRYPSGPNPSFAVPSTYTHQCKALIALVMACESYFNAQGIVPPPIPGGGGGPTLMQYTVFVAKNGADAGADGSVSKPFLTIQAAMDYAYDTYGSNDIRSCVCVNAGNYSDGPLVLPPRVSVMGEGAGNTVIVGDWSIDSLWSGPDLFLSSWINLELTGNILIDFNAALSEAGKLTAQGVVFNNEAEFREKLTAPSDNSVTFSECFFYSEGIVLKGIPTFFRNCNTVGGCTIRPQQQTGNGVHNTFQTMGGSIGSILISCMEEGTQVYECKFNHSVLPGAQLIVFGPFSTIIAADSSLPLQANISLLNGANADQIVRTNQNVFSGISASRPASPYVGQQFFDTTLGSPIWWNGTVWVNGVGGTDAMQGIATLGNNAGFAIVLNALVTVNTRIMFSVQEGPAPLGNLYVSSRVPGVSFTISSTNPLDLCNFAWELVEPAP